MNKSMTALGITGFVLSIIAVLISWVPIVNNFAAVLGAIALPFAIAGIVATRRQEAWSWTCRCRYDYCCSVHRVHRGDSRRVFQGG